ncbi:MAG TPA: hypothetical protein VKB56_10535, partial [Terriglobales bacterium]|nr:hypothetical protein [Terriglobales bacterium]
MIRRYVLMRSDLGNAARLGFAKAWRQPYTEPTRRMSIGQTIRGYLWWTYPRGSVHYDVMVTLILAFIFLTPSTIFHDKPVSRGPSPTEVVVS